MNKLNNYLELNLGLVFVLAIYYYPSLLFGDIPFSIFSRKPLNFWHQLLLKGNYEERIDALREIQFYRSQISLRVLCDGFIKEREATLKKEIFQLLYELSKDKALECIKKAKLNESYLPTIIYLLREDSIKKWYINLKPFLKTIYSDFNIIVALDEAGIYWQKYVDDNFVSIHKQELKELCKKTKFWFTANWCDKYRLLSEERKVEYEPNIIELLEVYKRERKVGLLYEVALNLRESVLNLGLEHQNYVKEEFLSIVKKEKNIPLQIELLALANLKREWHETLIRDIATGSDTVLKRVAVKAAAMLGYTDIILSHINSEDNIVRGLVFKYLDIGWFDSHIETVGSILLTESDPMVLTNIFWKLLETRNLEKLKDYIRIFLNRVVENEKSVTQELLNNISWVILYMGDCYSNGLLRTITRIYPHFETEELMENIEELESLCFLGEKIREKKSLIREGLLPLYVKIVEEESNLPLSGVICKVKDSKGRSFYSITDLNGNLVEFSLPYDEYEIYVTQYE